MEEIKKIRAAAYCRVSTDEENQETSIKTQKESFDKTISEHADWELVEIFGDKGKTGLNTKRPGFQKMMAAVNEGKIDLILVKSISRLSRNTVDLLNFIREMKSKNVNVYFEKENVNTKDMASELLVTVFASFAQEESRSISENIRRGRRQRYMLGKPVWGGVQYGLKITEKGKRGIDEEQAAVVRRIFDMALKGFSSNEIADSLNADGITTLRGCQWNQSNLVRTLKNEKYKGDFLMQKSYTSNYLDGKQISNKDAALPQYYKENSHDAIVSKETFDLVQATIARKSQKNGSPQFPYYGFLKCPFCGKLMIRINGYGTRRDNLWLCGGSGDKQLLKDRTDCPIFVVNDKYIDRILIDAIKQLPRKDNENIAWCQEAIEEKGIISYAVLYKLVKEITFEDRWHLKIKWFDGNDTRHYIHYDYAYDIPMPEFEVDGTKSYIGELEIPTIIAGQHLRKEKDRERALKMIIIEKNPESDVPIVHSPKRIARYKDNEEGVDK